MTTRTTYNIYLDAKFTVSFRESSYEAPEQHSLIGSITIDLKQLPTAIHLIQSAVDTTLINLNTAANKVEAQRKHFN